eukprot:3131872-Amphidinium_carterae.1
MADTLLGSGVCNNQELTETAPALLASINALRPSPSRRFNAAGMASERSNLRNHPCCHAVNT